MKMSSLYVRIPHELAVAFKLFVMRKYKTIRGAIAKEVALAILEHLKKHDFTSKRLENIVNKFIKDVYKVSQKEEIATRYEIYETLYQTELTDVYRKFQEMVILKYGTTNKYITKELVRALENHIKLMEKEVFEKKK